MLLHQELRLDIDIALIVERFDLPVNLMVAHTCDEIVFGGVGVAMIRAVATWKARSKSITRENMRQII